MYEKLKKYISSIFSFTLFVLVSFLMLLLRVHNMNNIKPFSSGPLLGVFPFVYVFFISNSVA